MLTYKELKDAVAVILQRSGDDNYKLQIGTWLNLSLTTLYNRYDYFLELKDTHLFDSVDGTKRYYLPNNFEKPTRFYDITNNKKINIRTHEEYYDSNIANIADSTEGNVNNAYFTEVVGVMVQVATTGDTVQAKSSSASDAGIIVRVEGYLDSAQTIVGFENITLTGLTAVTGTTTFYKILHVSKSGDTTGYVTLENSSGTDLTILSQIDRISSHKAIDLGLIPDDSTTSFEILYKRKLNKLVNDYDYPFIECDDYLTYNACALGYQQDKEMIDRATMFQKQAQKALFGILHNQNTKLGTDFQHKMTTGLMQALRS